MVVHGFYTRKNISNSDRVVEKVKEDDYIKKEDDYIKEEGSVCKEFCMQWGCSGLSYKKRQTGQTEQLDILFVSYTFNVNYDKKTTKNL